ncbi:MAG: hypothetical protein IJ527_05700 [Prevotella sp.]|nr:hypothetical protein [Prevotella sp.]
MELNFSLSELNKKSPYVLESSGMYSFNFVTAQGKKYEIGFIQDLMISDEGVYQFFITTEDQFKTVLDRNIQQTVFVVIEEFFKNEGAVLDYICATEDHRQASRDRMFHQWYTNSLAKEQYHLRNMSIDIDGTAYFASVIMRNDNPRFEAMTEAIDRFIQDFQDKLR